MKDLNESFVRFTTEELRHALEVLKENDQEKNDRLLEYLGNECFCYTSLFNRYI